MERGRERRRKKREPEYYGRFESDGCDGGEKRSGTDERVR